MVQNYTPVMWDDKAFAFVPYEAFGDLPHYPKRKNVSNLQRAEQPYKTMYL